VRKNPVILSICTVYSEGLYVWKGSGRLRITVMKAVHPGNRFDIAKFSIRKKDDNRHSFRFIRREVLVGHMGPFCIVIFPVLPE